MADEHPVHLEFINRSVGNTALSMGTQTLPQLQALREILAGNARLAKEQTHPPLDLIREATALIGCVEALGLPLTSGEATDKNIDLLLRNNALQVHVHGLDVKWLEGADSLRALAENCWVEYDNQGPSLLKQLRTCYETGLARQQVVRLYNVPNETERRQQGLVMMQFGFIDLKGPVSFYQMTPSWRDFLVEIEAFEAKALEAIDLGLSALRILAFEDRGPSVVRRGSSRSFATHRKGKFWYLLTRELPADWFKVDKARAKVLPEARRWLGRVEEFFAAQGRRPTKDHCIFVIKEKFDLTETSALAVWRTASPSTKRPSGSASGWQMVSLSEIREIK